MFREDKVTEAAAHILEMFDGQKMKYIKLIKLIYMSDRLALEERGMSISGDHYYSMKLGPVPSNTDNLINYAGDPDSFNEKWSRGIENFGRFWSLHIQDAGNYQIELRKAPESNVLSNYELDVINRVVSQFGSYDPWDLVDHLHVILDEWKKVGDGERVPLPIKDILIAVGKSTDEQDQIVRELSVHKRADELFA